jgi:glycosyltransferase involved in cell wall biosynthesis
MFPLITLILTTHNREKYLGKAIESILSQTYPHFEVILWDDGSTDTSLAIAQHYATQDPRIRLFPSPHQGRALSLQVAHAHAKGDYLGWVGSDDLLMKG